MSRERDQFIMETSTEIAAAAPRFVGRHHSDELRLAVHGEVLSIIYATCARFGIPRPPVGSVRLYEPISERVSIAVDWDVIWPDQMFRRNIPKSWFAGINNDVESLADQLRFELERIRSAGVGLDQVIEVAIKRLVSGFDFEALERISVVIAELAVARQRLEAMPEIELHADPHPFRDPYEHLGDLNKRVVTALQKLKKP